MSNNKAVVFDTNSYRDFVTGKNTSDVLNDIVDLRKLEKRKNIVAYGVQVVGMEMLGNLATSSNNAQYTDCFNGIIAMSHHVFDDSKNDIWFIPDPDLHIMNSYFSPVPPVLEDLRRNFGGVIRDFKIDYSNALAFHNQKSTFIDIKKYIDNEEKDFSNNMISLISDIKNTILKNDPKISKGKLKSKILEFIENGPFVTNISKKIISKVANLVNIKLSSEQLIKMSNSLNKEFPLSVGFYKWICTKIVYNNINMLSNNSKKKRWNWIWDYQVTFLISNHTLNSKEVFIVTSDTDMKDVLKDLNYKNRVMNLSEYRAFLNT